MDSWVIALLFVGVLPFFLLPATIAFFGKHEDVGWIAGLNGILAGVPWLPFNMGAVQRVLVFAIVLVVWLGMLRWSMSAPSSTKAEPQNQA